MWLIYLVIALTAVITDSRRANQLNGAQLTFVVYHVSRSISLLFYFFSTALEVTSGND
jgi:hypothetical protein